MAGRLDPAIEWAKVGSMQLQYGGELYVARARAHTGEPFLAFFQHDRAGAPVGSVALDPRTAR